jgi:hypothetical protein
MFSHVKRNKIVFGLGIAIVLGILFGIEFGGTILATTRTVTPRSPSLKIPQEVITVCSADEAFKLTGYPIVSLSFIPEGFQHTGKYIVTRIESGQGNSFYTIRQIWFRSDNPKVYITILQDPKLFGIGGGETAEVAGVVGERKLTSENEERDHSTLTLYWRDGDMAYLISGYLSDSVNEDLLQKNAISIQYSNIISN